MQRDRLARILQWIVLLAAVIVALGMYRYFRISPELRFAEIEARWLLAPPLLLALLAAAALVGRDERSSS